LAFRREDGVDPMPEDDDPLLADADDLAVQLVRDGRRRRLIAIGLICFVVLAGVYLAFGRSLERAWHLSRAASAAAERDAKMTTLERVHAELLPRWLIQVNNGESEQVVTWTHLETALTPAPMLLDTVSDMKSLLAEPDGARVHSERLLELTGDWNEYLDRVGEPWWVDTTIRISPKQTIAYVKTYKLLADFTVLVAGRPYRTRMAARADRTNILESLLGHTSPGQDGAIILTDRLYDFALSEVWPLLGEVLTDPTARQRAFQVRVAGEAKAALPTGTLGALREAAAARGRLERVLTAVRDRHRCGSQFSILDLPWDGMEIEETDMLRRVAKRDRFESCPRITGDEVEVIATVSDELRDNERLQAAAEALVAHIAYAVTIHEARHSADHDVASAFIEPLPCARCDALRLGKRTRAELSAYLAQFTSATHGYTSLYQACGLDFTRPTPHALALRVIFGELGIDCEHTPPPGLQSKASAMAQAFFGRSDRIEMPESFPTRLELYR